MKKEPSGSFLRYGGTLSHICNQVYAFAEALRERRADAAG